MAAFPDDHIHVVEPVDLNGLQNAIVVRQNGRLRGAALSPPNIPLVFHPRWNLARTVELIALLGYLLILWVGWLGKYAGERERDYAEYLTNWSWTLQTLCYTIKVIAYIDPTSRVLWFYYNVLFWPMTTLVWTVFVLVTFVLQDNPHLIVVMFKEYGGGTVLFFNTVYHYLPPIMAFYFIILVHRDHAQTLWLSKRGLVVHVLWQVSLVHIPVLLYATIFDYDHVYGLHELDWWNILLLYETTCVFVWPIALLLSLSSASSWRGEGGEIPTHTIEQALNPPPSRAPRKPREI